jgi:hypothetical protein
MSTPAVQPPQASRPPASALGNGVFFFLIACLLLAPIWLVKYPPLLDYPNHLARTFVLAHLHDRAFRFQQFYSGDWGFYPYLTMDLSLIALQRIVPVLLAGRIFLSFCMLALPLAAWFFLRQANPGEDHLALWALLQAHNIFFLYAFLNFHLSVALGLVAAGLWLRYLARPRLALWFLLVAVCTAIYFTHLVGFALTALLVTAYGWLARRKMREILLTWLAFLPGALLYLYSSRVGLTAGRDFTLRTFTGKFDGFWDIMHGYSKQLDHITLLALVVYFLAACWRNPDFRWNTRWLGLAAVLLVVYWALPWGFGEEWDLDIRVLPVLFVVILATAKVGRRGWKLAPLALLLFVARTADMTKNFIAAQPELAGLARSFQATPANARVLPIVEADEDDPVRHPFAHFWAYGVVQRGWFSPYLFQIKGVIPLQIKYDAYSPDGFWDLGYDETPDWKQVREDYDYVWAYNVPRFELGLAAIGDEVFEDGDLQVFRLNKSADSESVRRPSGRKEPED